MSFVLFALVAAAIATSVDAYVLSGYLCPTCPSAKNPTTLIASINAGYNRVNIAFLGWDSSGNVINQFDDSSKGFTLTSSMVSSLQSQGRKVFISLGGGAGNILSCSGSNSYSSNLLSGLLSYTSKYGFDGVDFDIEHRSGDYVKCDSMIASVMNSLHSHGLQVSMAPQMTNLYPELNTVSAGFNELAPLVSMVSASTLQTIQPQMYNTWSTVETTAFAAQYVQELNAGYNVTSDGQFFPVRVPPSRIILGYPASRSGAGSGYIAPAQLKTLYGQLKSKGLQIDGFMTWSIGWDQQNGWDFANTLKNLS